jgi:DNA replication and repair protein RecF
VTAARGSDFRCYERVTVELEPGVVGVVGPNGAGKTALVEMIHFGALGYSPRTSAEQQMVRFGCDVLRTEVDAELRDGAAAVAIGFRPGEPKRITLNGARERSVEGLLGRFPVLVFTPDRLRLVQGAPALRRAYFDRVLARLWPRLGTLAGEFARRLSQRNHLLKRVRTGAAAEDALDPWDALLADAGAELTAARARLCERLAAPLRARMADLGGDPGEAPLRYRPNLEGGAESFRTALHARRRRDVERAGTGAGPQLDDYALVDGDRDLRSYGSQGEQRRTLLALILAEADVLAAERDEQPLLLLDDVTSELDGRRRELLLAAVGRFSQSVLTTTDESHLAGAPAQVLLVDAGQVRA